MGFGWMYESYKDLLKSDEVCNIDCCVSLLCTTLAYISFIRSNHKARRDHREVPFSGEKCCPPVSPLKILTFIQKREEVIDIR